MRRDTSAEPNQLYALAHQALQAARWDDCIALLEQVERLLGANPAVLHMRALALRGTGRDVEAMPCFEQALALQPPPGDPFLFANTARLLEALGQERQALERYAQACRAAPQAQEIQLARIGAIRRLVSDEAADQAFADLLAANPGSADLHHYHALFLRDCGQCERALAAIRQAITLRPESAKARQLQARIELDLGRGKAADFTELAQAAPDDEALAMGEASAHVQQGHQDRALETLDAALMRHPDWAAARQTRLSITKQLVSLEVAEDWLWDQAAAHPELSEIGIARIVLIWRERGVEAALKAFAASQLDRADDINARLLQADLLSESGDNQGADRLFRKLEPAWRDLPPQLRMAEVRHRFRTGSVDQGTALAHEIALSSGLIEAWAHVELGWRLAGDSRWDWLMQSGELVQQSVLPNFSDYGSQLVDLLKRLHDPIRNHPSEQSPRGGTQTDGMLFNRGEPEIRALVADIRRNVRQYVEGLRVQDRQHPMARLQRRNFRFSGSWSIRLTGAGYHNAHFHNEGLLSSACYLKLPDVMSAAAANPTHEGWLELGRPPDGLNMTAEPYCLIEPKVGTLALFPSFLLHGTRPFDEGERITAAFDVTAITD